MFSRIIRLSAPALLVLAAGSAAAQSINVDVNRSASTAVPGSTYRAASSQAGVWNNVLAGTSGSVALVGLDGLSTGLTVTRAGSGGGDATSIAGASADFSTLMSDYQTTTGVNAGPDFTVNGLSQGFYRVYVYASLPGASAFYTDGFGLPVYYTNYVGVSLNNVSVGSAVTSGAMVANTFTKGVTHGVFNVSVGAGAPPMKISVKTGSGSNEKCALNGFQVVKYGNRIYVDKSKNSGANTGTSWADAFTDLQEALATVRQSAGVLTEVWVARGSYTPTTTNDRTKSFDLVSGVKLYGGFAGSEATLAARDLQNPANLTTLSGDIAAPFVGPDNSFHVVTGTNLSAATVFDGFVVAKGYADGALVSGQQDGSLMYLQTSSPTISNCSLVDGVSRSTGGAVYANHGTPSIVKCQFLRNDSLYGAGVYWASSVPVSATPMKMYNCMFNSNVSDFEGAALVAEGGKVAVANCVFTNNQGTGLLANYNASASGDTITATNCTINGNRGSVFYTYNGAAQVYNNCIIWGNVYDGQPRSALQNTGWGFPRAQNVTIQGTCIQGWNSAQVPGILNTGANPEFVDADGADNSAGTLDDDLRLSPHSPLIDAGINGYMALDLCDLDADGITSAETVPFDMDGLNRRFDVPFISNGGAGFGAIVDLGAYEAQFTVPPCGTSDFDGDGDSGTDADIEAFFACLAGNCCVTCGTSDFNGDGDFGTDADIEAFFSVLGGGSC